MCLDVYILQRERESRNEQSKGEKLPKLQKKSSLKCGYNKATKILL